MNVDRNCLVARTVNTQTRDKDTDGILALAGKLLGACLKPYLPTPTEKMF